MNNSLFLQSDVDDPYTHYTHMRARQPIWHDDANAIWAVYSHAGCKRVLETESAHIPGQNPAAASLLNTQSATLVAHLARLSNPPRHVASRQAVMRLFECMKAVDTGALLTRLIGTAREFDWVDAVGKKLPALAVLMAFGFSERDIETILPLTEGLTKLMLPNKSAQQVADVNAITEVIWPLVERHVTCEMQALAESDASGAIHVANLIGLLIQSVDAGRGMLSNALLQALRHAPSNTPNRDACRRIVIETLRFDPPIHNTRRVLTEDLTLDHTALPKGAAVLVVMASANRDERVFAQADRFDAARDNNTAHLSFGAGAHACAAHHFSIALAADAMAALFDGRTVTLLEGDIHYEPLINARLPKKIVIRTL